MERIKDIQDYIDDAFDTWAELNCGLGGLFGYVQEYNECFMKKEDNPDRAAHVILFAKKAILEGCEIPDEIERECRIEMSYLESEKPLLLKEEINFLKNKF